MQVVTVKAMAQTEAGLEMMIKPQCFAVLQVANNTTSAAAFVSLSLAWVVSVISNVKAAIVVICITVVVHASLSTLATHSIPLTIRVDDVIIESFDLGSLILVECLT